MSKIGSTVTKLGGLVAALALIIGVTSSQAMCVAFYHQPKIPQGMSKFSRRN